jgi:hypothetical protein
MFEWLRWRSSLKRNVNFWDWVRDTYSDEELKGLMTEATECSLILPAFDPYSDNVEVHGRIHTLEEYTQELVRKTAKRLMKRYGDDIWQCCLGAGGYDPDEGKVGLKCLSGLDLAFQVCDQATFEEFLVRNALKRASQQVLEERRKKKTS